ncbi:MlaD family protein [Alphaproteobacteria bacterium]|nr:MlaD family protein [Alphaproteobacteria bacterium]
MKKINFNFELVLGLLVLISMFFIIYKIFFNFNDNQKIENNFSIIAEFNNVGNLKIGNDVRINGVNSGEVSNLFLNTEDFVAIVEINFNDIYKISNDSIFSIATDGLIGGSYINIKPGNKDIFLINGDKTTNTLDAISLENIISDIIFNN